MWWEKFRSVSIGPGIQNLGTVATPALLFLLLSIPAVPRREFREGQGQHPQIMWFFKIFQWWILLEYVSIFFLCWWFRAFFIFPYILGISSSQLTFIFFRGVGIPPTSFHEPITHHHYMNTYSELLVSLGDDLRRSETPKSHFFLCILQWWSIYSNDSHI